MSEILGFKWIREIVAIVGNAALGAIASRDAIRAAELQRQHEQEECKRQTTP